MRVAQTLAAKHAGATAWSCEVNSAIGEYGEPTVLFQAGNVPEME